MRVAFVIIKYFYILKMDIPIKHYKSHKSKSKQKIKQGKDIQNSLDITNYQNYENDNDKIFFIIQMGKGKNCLAKSDISERVWGNCPSVTVDVGTN